MKKGLQASTDGATVPAGSPVKRVAAKKAGTEFPRIGVHVSVAGGLEKGFENAALAGCDCMQIFVKNQRQWRAKPLSDQQIAAFVAARDASSVQPIVAHASYLLNLAAPSEAVREMSINAMEDELTRCEVLGIEGLVFHPGAHCDGEVRDPYEIQVRNAKFEVKKTRQRGNQATKQYEIGKKDWDCGGHVLAGIERIARGMDEVHARCAGFASRLLLECTAGQGSAIGWQFEQLAEILKRVREPDRVSICLDTCHLFAAGYDFRTPETYAAMIDRLDAAVGVAKVRCIHCNDSKRELGSRVDRHDHIGKGLIGKAGFAHFLNDARFREVPFILETPKETDAKGRDMDRVNVQQLRRLVRRQD